MPCITRLNFFISSVIHTFTIIDNNTASLGLRVKQTSSEFMGPIDVYHPATSV